MQTGHDETPGVGIGPGPTRTNRTALLVRVWVPDRPGALGAVASRIGAVGGDLHEIEVVDREDGRAVDELAVTLPSSCPLDLLAREIDEIEDVSVEELEVVPALPLDPRMAAFAAALELATAADPAALATAVTAQVVGELRADHVAVVDADGSVISRRGDEADEPARIAACRAGRIHGRSRGESVGRADGSGRAEGLVWAVVAEGSWLVVVARRRTSLRARELRVLGALAELAGQRLAAWGGP